MGAAAIGGGVLGAGLLAGALGPSQAPASQMVYNVDPNLQAMSNQANQNAANYQQNLGQTQQAQQDTAAAQARQSLAQNIAGVRSNANARGMLYGGFEQGGEASATAQNQAQLNQAYQNVNNNTQNTLQGLQSQAVQQGTGVQQAQNSANQLAYNIALQRQQQATGAFGGLLAGAGGVAGLAAAGK